MVYRKHFLNFLYRSGMSDKEAALFLGCTVAALRLWKANENTAPKDVVEHLEIYVAARERQAERIASTA